MLTPFLFLMSSHPSAASKAGSAARCSFVTVLVMMLLNCSGGSYASGVSEPFLILGTRPSALLVARPSCLSAGFAVTLDCMKWVCICLLLLVAVSADMHTDEDEGVERLCASGAVASSCSHLPSFCEYVLSQLGLERRHDGSSSRAQAVWLACSSYLFVRASEEELLERLARAMAVNRSVAMLFLSEFRQRRAEYFSRSWLRYEEMIELNAHEYREWQRAAAERDVGRRGGEAAPTPTEEGGLEFGQMSQLERLPGRVVVVVTAPFCSWCRLLEPVFQQLSRRALVARVDARSTALVEQLRVRRFPEVLVWDEGKERARYPLQAARDVESLSHWLEEQQLALSDAAVPLRWQTVLPASELEALRTELASKRRLASVQEALRAMGGCCGNASVTKRFDPPTIVFLGGGIAAGKSTLLLSLRDTEFWKQRGEEAVCVEADRFKLADPLFAELAQRGAHGFASFAVHRDSTDAAEELLLAALHEERTIVFDGTCKWAPFVLQTIAMVRRVHRSRTRRGHGYRGPGDEQYWEQEEEDDPAKHRAPYRVWLIGAFSAVNVAVGRSVRRAILDGRSASLPDLLRSHKSFATNFETYAALADEVMLFDNTKSRPLEVAPPLVASKKNMHDALHLHDEHAMERFRRIADIDQGATSVFNLHGEGEGTMQHSLESHAAPPSLALLQILNSE